MKKPANLVYGLNDSPPLHAIVLNGVQHVGLIAINPLEFPPAPPVSSLEQALATPSTRLPSTKVPLVDLRSVISASYSSTSTRQCAREPSESGSTTSHGG